MQNPTDIKRNSEASNKLTQLPVFINLFIILMFKRDFHFVLLVIFGVFVNHGIHSLRQEIPVSLLIIIISMIKHDHMTTATKILFYISAVFQILRLTKTRFYKPLKQIRVWGGPVYGCIIFWRLIKVYGMTWINLASLIIFLVGVFYRPDSEEGDYDKNKKKHKYCMILSFSLITLNDIIS